jgi:putative FmdB family regulatory protein
LPTYEYACTAGGHRLEAVQKFSDDPLTVCPECGGPLRKVYSAVGISFKGSGFYKTDSRTSTSNGSEPKSTAPGESSGEGAPKKEAAGSGSEKSSEKSTEKPPAKASEKSPAPSTSAAAG